jgi:hypothetical protein
MVRNFVLFLGAGFSKGAGLPTMSEFGTESDNELLALKISNNKRDSTPYLTKAGDIFEKFQSYCKRADSFVKLDIDDMEQLFCIAEALDEAGIETLDFNGGPIPIKELLIQIKIWLWKIYQQCPPLNRNKNISPETIEAYKGFIRFLRDSNLSDRLTVLTTNYDLIFEYFAWKGGISCNYPFNGDKVKVEPLNVFSKDVSEYYASVKPIDTGPLVCKLHGSINYFNLEAPDKVGISYDIARPEDDPFVPDIRPAIFMLNAIWKLQQKFESKKIEPAIIPPTYAKLQKHSWLQETWKASIKALEDATHIIFIGYSIPESDGFIRAMITGAMAGRNTKANLQVFIIDPDKDGTVFNRYNKLFPHLERFVKSGFCDAWNSGEILKILSAVNKNNF